METFVFILITLSSIVCGVVYSFASKDYEIRNLLRRKRSLLFPNPLDSETKIQVLFGLGLPMEGEISMTLGYVLKCNYNLPYNGSASKDGPYVRHVRAVTPGNTRPPLNERGGISRWSLYRLVEMAMGKACLLRAVCEAAEIPFDDGLLGQLLRLSLTPSTTNEEYELYSDREYRAAELIGRKSDGGACGSSYPECLYSPLDYFTKKIPTIF